MLLLTIYAAVYLPLLALSASIPQSLQNSVPDCAWSCFSSYIHSNYPSSICADSNDVDCLCSHAGTQGFTLQEGAFVCAHQNCNGQTSLASINGTYDICAKRPSALPATHTLLPTAFTAKPAQTASVSSSLSLSAAITPSPASSQTSSTTSSAALSSPSPSHGLQTSQIVGITVACVAVVIVMGSIAAFMICMRRRRGHHEQLDSGKLSYEEFKPVVIAEKRSLPDMSGMKDPRGGRGGVGVAPVRYKAILPPANLFAQGFPAPTNVPAPTQRQPAALGIAQPIGGAQTVEMPSGPATPPPAVTARAGQVPLQTRPTAPFLTGVISMASSVYSVDQHRIPDSRRWPSGSTVARPPSILIPGRLKPSVATSGAHGRESTTSQLTQFEEDSQESDTMAATSGTGRPNFQRSSSSEATMFSQDASSSSTSSGAPSKRSNRPSLSISIPGKPPSQSALPPPPPKLANQNSNPQRSAHNGARTVQSLNVQSKPMSLGQHGNSTQDQRRAPALMNQISNLNVTTLSSRPAQFPAPPSGRLVAQAPASGPRKDSVSRRGFSQPNTTAYRSTAQADTKQLTVGGERINYPHIPPPSVSPTKVPTSNILSASQIMNLPPPPPGPPPRFAGAHYPGQHGVIPASTEATDWATNSLLAKRRGNEQATALGSQLKIHNSHGSTSDLSAFSAPNSMTSTPENSAYVRHSRVDGSNTMTPHQMGARDAQSNNQRPLHSSPTMNERQPHSGASVQQPGSSQGWTGSNATRGAQNPPQYPYTAYQLPPPPLRSGGQRFQQPLLSPTPAQLTPTRRGNDMYLSFQ